MSSELPYEAPTRTREPVSSEAEPGMPMADPTVSSTGTPNFAAGPESELPQDILETQAKLIQAAATYERQEIERVLAGFYDSVMQVFDERLRNLHDPKTVFLEGVRYGAAAVVAALVVLLVLGLLFLFGLSVVRPV